MTARFHSILAVLLVYTLAGCSHFAGPRRESRASVVGGDNPAILWVDWEGTRDVLDDAETCAKFCNMARASGITTLALEARDRQGNIILEGQQTLIAAARKSQLDVAAILPLFYSRPDTPSDRLLQQAVWDGDGYTNKPFPESGPLPPRLSPTQAVNQRAERDAIDAVLNNRDVTLLILTDLGFGTIDGDVSAPAKQAFLAWAGVSIRQWPEEIVGYVPTDSPLAAESHGPGWSIWMAWRATVLKEFLTQIRGDMASHSVQPAPRLAVLVDAPYSAHQRLGLNWASVDSSIEAENPWLSPGYNTTAVGHLVDATVLGYWRPDLLRIEDAEKSGNAWWASVEGSTAQARRYQANGTAVYGTTMIQTGESWGFTAQMIHGLTDGVLLIAASQLLEHPANWQTLREVLTVAQMAKTAGP